MKKILLLLLATTFSFAAATPTTPDTNAISVATQIAPVTPRAPNNATASAIPPAPDFDAAGYVLLDANSGAVLAQKNMNERLPPASLTKLMSIYLVFNALKHGQIHLDDEVPISKKAWETGGSKMFVRVGTTVPLEDLLRGAIVASGNDAVVAMAQYVGGTQTTFVEMMNQTAQRLGMVNTHYSDPTGLPDPNHYSTPYDLALLVQAIIHDFPEYYHYFSEKWITYNKIKQPNRNRLLWHDSWVDGLKTGHTEAAGFCLIASGLQNEMRLISVVMGAPTDAGRTDDSQALLNYGYRYFETKQLYAADQSIATPRVWMGENSSVSMGVDAPLFVTVPKGQLAAAQISIEPTHPLKAPIIKGKAYGQIVIRLNGQTISTTPLLALQDDPVGGFLSRLIDRIHMWFAK